MTNDAMSQKITKLQKQLVTCRKARQSGSIILTGLWEKNASLEANITRLHSSLSRLVRLKNHKDTVGKDAHYYEEQPLAWAEAKMLIDQINL